MKKEDLLKAMSEIDSELIRSSEYKKQPKGWIKWAAMAAGLALVLFVVTKVDISPQQSGGQSAEVKSSETGRNSQSGGNGQIGEASQTGKINDGASQVAKVEQEQENKQNTGNAQEDGALAEVGDAFVDIDALLASKESNGVFQESSLAISMMEINGCTAVYECIFGLTQDELKECLGTQLEGTNWHYVKGHRGIQYLIEKNDNEYQLLKFLYCESENYSYKDILEDMYGVMSYKDIAKIIVEPSTINNTDEGKKLQEKIGTKEITEESQIQAFYEMLSSRACYGADNWDMIETGGDTGSGMVDAVTQVRYLTIETVNKEVFEIKYTALSDMFYQYMGVAYEPLSKEQAATMEDMLGIQ